MASNFSYSFTAQNFFFMSENEVPEKKFDFGPRIKMKPPQRIGEPLSDRNVAAATGLGVMVHHKERLADYAVPSSNHQIAHSMSEIGPGQNVNDLVRRIAQLEKERDEWKLKAEAAIAQSELSLGDMLVEIELESLREEVKRLTDILATKTGTAVTSTDDNARLRLRCSELECQVVNLKKEKAQAEQKNTAARNADLNRIRALQEQVTHEKRMRERAVAYESSLQVVSVDRPSTPSNPSNGVLVRPRSGSVPENPVALPSFVVNAPSDQTHATPKPSVKRDPVSFQPAPAVDVSKILDKTVILPNPRTSTSVTTSDLIGDDYIASQWKSLLVEKPASWKSLLSRMPNTNIFCFGSLKVACKKIGNNIMIQLGRETMMLDKFIDTYGPEQAAALGLVVPTSSTAHVPAPTKPPPVTMKSILASKKN